MTWLSLALAGDLDAVAVGHWVGGPQDGLNGVVMPYGEALLLGNGDGATDLFAAGEVLLLDDPLAELVLLDVVLAGEEEHDRLGCDLAVADGLWLVGADQGALDEPDPGQVRVYQDGELLLSLVGQRRDGLGAQVEAGDLDGDGEPEWVFAAPYAHEGQGSVYVVDPLPVTGQVATSSLDDAIQGNDGAHLGWSLRVVDDLDGDGLEDLVVASSPLGEAQLAVFSGGERVGAWTLSDPDSWLGWSLDGAEGRLVVGSPWMDDAKGRVWLLEGAPAGVSSLQDSAATVWVGQGAEGLGSSVALGPSLVLGAANDSRLVVDGQERDLRGVGRLGERVQWLPDLTGDAVPELLAFAPLAQDRAGEAWVLDGALLGTLDELPLEDDGGPDLDGDGWSADEDCDDRDPRVAPDADEICSDAVDQDCDGEVDERPCVRGCSTGPAPRWLAPLALLLLWRRSWS